MAKLKSFLISFGVILLAGIAAFKLASIRPCRCAQSSQTDG